MSKALILAGLVALLSIAGFAYQSYSEYRDQKLAPGKFVKVGDQTFHLLCRGSGEPTVILENGRWGSYPDWIDVLDGVSKSTRVCSYDRLGMGWSSAETEPTRSSYVAQNLWRLLNAAEIHESIILVGFSAGGLYVRKFYELYPDHVVGMVLLESSHEQQVSRMSHIPEDLSMVTLCDAVSWTGMVRLLGMMRSNVPQTFSPERFKEQLGIYNRTSFCSGLIMAAEGLPLDQMDETPPKPVGDLPLIVVTGGKPLRDQAIPSNFSEKFLQEHETVWPLFQAELASISSQSEQWIAEKSGHGIPIEQPEIAVRAIKKLVVGHRRQQSGGL